MLEEKLTASSSYMINKCIRTLPIHTSKLKIVGRLGQQKIQNLSQEKIDVAKNWLKVVKYLKLCIKKANPSISWREGRRCEGKRLGRARGAWEGLVIQDGGISWLYYCFMASISCETTLSRWLIVCQPITSGTESQQSHISCALWQYC